MVAQSARRGEDNLRTNFIQSAMLLHRGATAIEATGFDIRLEAAQHFLTLQRQFAGGENHYGLNGRNVLAEEFEHGEEVSQGLA